MPVKNMALVFDRQDYDMILDTVELTSNQPICTLYQSHIGVNYEN